MFSVWCPSVEDSAGIILNNASKILVRGDGVVAVTSLVADSCFMTSSDSIQCPASKLNAARAGLLRISWFFMRFCSFGGAVWLLQRHFSLCFIVFVSPGMDSVIRGPGLTCPVLVYWEMDAECSSPDHAANFDVYNFSFCIFGFEDCYTIRSLILKSLSGEFMAVVERGFAVTSCILLGMVVGCSVGYCMDACG
ncbi:hypothetical protein AKJ16_DCAP12391 [Drosera capensis]